MRPRYYLAVFVALSLSLSVGSLAKDQISQSRHERSVCVVLDESDATSTQMTKAASNAFRIENSPFAWSKNAVNQSIKHYSRT